jgi:DNA/RNA endonuclease G (NUC1)
MFASAAAARTANRALLDRLETLDPDNLPADFLAEIEAFRLRAGATGAILSPVEDRSELQTSINFWTTMLFTSAGRPASVVLARFDTAAARLRAGQAVPSKGLEPFQIEDHDKFFGRNPCIAEMFDKLSDHRFLAVLGLSGSGKSSVVRAGLIPRLRQSAAPGSWLVLDPVVPGRRPLDALAQVIEQVSPGAEFQPDPDAFVAALDRSERRVLIVIDQFEELFTLDPAEDERRQFLDILRCAATTGAHAHVVILTMRSEFDSRVRRYEDFDALFEAGRVQIAALSPRELRSAIVQPAEQLGVAFAPGLAEELVQAVVGEPAGLPLLQFTLLELWKLRSDENELTWQAYKALGGNPRDILAQRADKIYGDFALKEDRDISRGIFIALVQLGAGLEPTSRRVLRSELGEAVGRGRDNVDRVLGKWRENGLVRISPPGAITSDSQVEVAHEALIRNWALLGEWIGDAFASARRRGLLTEKALAWKENKGELLGELSLIEAETYESLTDDERDYVEASQAELDQARQKMRRRVRIAYAGSVMMALLTVTATVAIVAASRFNEAARSQQLVAESAIDEARAAETRARWAMAASRQSRANADRRVREARDRLRIADEHLGNVRLQEAKTEVQLQLALARQSVVNTATAAVVGNLAALRTQVVDLERQVTDLGRQVTDLGRQREDLERQRAALELQRQDLERQVQVAQAGRVNAELQTEAERNVRQQVFGAIGRGEVAVSTAALQQPAETRTVAERLPANLAQRRARAPLGLPDAPLVVDRRVYTVGFDPAILSPRWVAFTVDARNTLDLPRRDRGWAFDPDIPRAWQTGPSTYRGNSYDRGNLIRRADALVGPSEADARASEAEIFYYSVTVPQTGRMNRTTWVAVEQYTTRLSERLGPIYVIAGPVYPDLTASNRTYLTLGSTGTTVPLYLYRVLLRRDADGRWRSLAFLVPNDFSTSGDALQFVTSVSEIERLTGLRFFSALPAAEAAALKSNASAAEFGGPAANR